MPRQQQPQALSQEQQPPRSLAAAASLAALRGRGGGFSLSALRAADDAADAAGGTGCGCGVVVLVLDFEAQLFRSLLRVHLCRNHDLVVAGLQLGAPVQPTVASDAGRERVVGSTSAAALFVLRNQKPLRPLTRWDRHDSHLRGCCLDAASAKCSHGDGRSLLHLSNLFLLSCISRLSRLELGGQRLNIFLFGNQRCGSLLVQRSLARDRSLQRRLFSQEMLDRGMQFRSPRAHSFRG